VLARPDLPLISSPHSWQALDDRSHVLSLGPPLVEKSGNLLVGGGIDAEKVLDLPADAAQAQAIGQPEQRCRALGTAHSLSSETASSFE
jgi:hypothetical protein